MYRNGVKLTRTDDDTYKCPLHARFFHTLLDEQFGLYDAKTLDGMGQRPYNEKYEMDQLYRRLSAPIGQRLQLEL